MKNEQKPGKGHGTGFPAESSTAWRRCGRAVTSLRDRQPQEGARWPWWGRVPQERNVGPPPVLTATHGAHLRRPTRRLRAQERTRRSRRGGCQRRFSGNFPKWENIFVPVLKALKGSEQSTAACGQETVTSLQHQAALGPGGREARMPQRRYRTGPCPPRPLVKHRPAHSPQSEHRMSLPCKWKFFAQCL